MGRAQWRKTLRTSTSQILLPCLLPHELPLSRVAARREAHRPSPRRHPLRTARRLPRLEAFRRRAMPILTHAAVLPAPRLETLLVFLLLQCAHKRRARLAIDGRASCCETLTEEGALGAGLAGMRMGAETEHAAGSCGDAQQRASHAPDGMETENLGSRV